MAGKIDEGGVDLWIVVAGVCYATFYVVDHQELRASALVLERINRCHSKVASLLTRHGTGEGIGASSKDGDIEFRLVDFAGRGINPTWLIARKVDEELFTRCVRHAHGGFVLRFLCLDLLVKAGLFAAVGGMCQILLMQELMSYLAFRLFDCSDNCCDVGFRAIGGSFRC